MDNMHVLPLVHQLCSSLYGTNKLLIVLIIASWSNFILPLTSQALQSVYEANYRMNPLIYWHF